MIVTSGPKWFSYRKDHRNVRRLMPILPYEPDSHLFIGIRTLKCDTLLMTSREFIRRTRACARRTGQSFRFDKAHGMDSHGRVYVAARYTAVKRGELRAGMLAAMLRQLEIARREF